MKTKYFACVLTAAALLLGASIAQAETLYFGETFDALTADAMLTGQNNWQKMIVTGWQDPYVMAGEGANTSNVLSRGGTLSNKGAGAIRSFAPIFFNTGDTVNLYFWGKALKSNALVGVAFEGQANQVYGVFGVEFQTSPAGYTNLKAYARNYTGTESRTTANNTVIADNWYEYRVTYDFSVAGGQASLAYRNITLNEDTFTPIADLTNKAMNIPTVSGQYKAVGINVRTDLSQLPGNTYWPASVMIDNIGFGAQVSSIPEPSTLALLAAGLVGLLAYAWRKRK